MKRFNQNFGGSLKWILVSASCGWYSRYGFNLWPLTLNVTPSFGFSISTAPYGYTFFTINGPFHFDFNFSGNK